MVLIDTPVDLSYYYLKKRSIDIGLPLWSINIKKYESVVGPLPVAEFIDNREFGLVIPSVVEYLFDNDPRFVITKRNGSPSLGDLIVGVGKKDSHRTAVVCCFFVSRNDWAVLYRDKGVEFYEWKYSTQQTSDLGYIIVDGSTWLEATLLNEINEHT
jgi:hypothetical protein